MSVSKVEYLYGEHVATTQWKFMDYHSVLKLKNRLAKARIEKLNQVDMLERDYNNINDCLKAIKFNDELLEELSIKG